MRRLALILATPLGISGIAILAAPLWLPPVLATRGVTVGSAHWCGVDLCFLDVRRGEAHATGVTVGLDRVAHVEAPVVPMSTGRGAGRAGVPLLSRIEVRGLTVPGTPLPPLDGEVWPTRHLVGEGVIIDADTARATLPTPFGTIDVEVSPADGGADVVARCATCVLPAPSEADVPLRLPPVVIRGRYDDGVFDGTVRIEAVTATVKITRQEPSVERADPATPGRGQVVVHLDGSAPPAVSGPLPEHAQGDAGNAATPASPTELRDPEAALRSLPADTAFRATVTMAETPVADLYEVLRAWVPEVERARVQGTASGVVELTWPGGVTHFTPSVADFSVTGLVGEGLAAGAFTFRGHDASGEETVFRSGEGTPNWTPLARMGVWLPAAVIAAEDAGFKAHPGYDLDGIRAAFEANTAEGDVVRGGSTLSQQLAKNLFLDGTRSYARKLRELLYAVDLDHTLGKPRVLELYLNVVEFGPGLRGARAAAQTYFLKEPEGLLPEEAAWLASILRFPRTAWSRQYQADRVDQARVRWILENLRDVPEEPRRAALGRQVHLVPP